ncbi:C40 family peptidase [Pedobacter sp. NJ-S-72]
MILRSVRASHLIIVLAAMAFFSSCGSRKHAAYKDTRGAKAAEVLSEVQNKSLYRFITDWTGVRYRLGGLDKRGIDCSGFALLLNKEIYGVNLPRRSRDQAEVIKQKNISQLKEGDLIFFSFGGNGIDHVGVYLNHGYFVHASYTWCDRR